MSRIFSRASWSGRSITEKQNRKEEEVRKLFDMLDVSNYGYLHSEVVREAITTSGLDPRVHSIEKDIQHLIDEEGKVTRKRERKNSLIPR